MNPKISIVTVVYNNRENLLRTIESVRKQVYDNIEFIIIDGGSTDGTIEIIKANEDIIYKWISGKDNGIYDAMNKGIRLATGDYIWFLNGGDVIYSDDTLQKMFSLSDSADVFYGDTELVDDTGKSFGRRKLKTPPENLSWKDMINGMIITHQSLIMKRNIIPEYDLKYIHCADIDWTIKVLKKSKEICNTHLILSKFLMGGYSRKNTIKSLIERWKILSSYFNFVHILFVHIKLSFKFIIHIIRNRRIL